MWAIVLKCSRSSSRPQASPCIVHTTVGHSAAPTTKKSSIGPRLPPATTKNMKTRISVPPSGRATEETKNRNGAVQLDWTDQPPQPREPEPPPPHGQQPGMEGREHHLAQPVERQRDGDDRGRHADPQPQGPHREVEPGDEIHRLLQQAHHVPGLPPPKEEEAAEEHAEPIERDQAEGEDEHEERPGRDGQGRLEE